MVSFVCKVDRDIRGYRRIKEKKSFVERMEKKIKRRFHEKKSPVPLYQRLPFAFSMEMKT
jgi:hypothetical protein